MVLDVFRKIHERLLRCFCPIPARSAAPICGCPVALTKKLRKCQGSHSTETGCRGASGMPGGECRETAAAVGSARCDVNSSSCSIRGDGTGQNHCRYLCVTDRFGILLVIEIGRASCRERG